jgi:NADH-quinone oxidoreductase subunit E
MVELDTIPAYFADKQEVLDEILGRYPEYGKRSAVMPLLWEVQNAERYVSEARIAEIAEILGMHPTEVKGVMSFYSEYHGEPVGRYHLQVCSTLSCSLAGSDQLYDYLVEKLGIVNGETDADGRFSIQKVECLGSCGTGPVLQVNDVYYERVSRTRCDQLIDALAQGDMPEPWRARGGDNEGAEKADFLAGAAAAGASSGEGEG